LFIFLEDRILNDGLVFVRAQDDADGGVVIVAALEVVEHPDIHVDLADVLMAELAGLEVDDDEALEQVVVEHQVDVEVSTQLTPSILQK